jgi:hypothetical protein
VAGRLDERVADEIADLAVASVLADEDVSEEDPRRRSLARLRRELGRIARRDYFPPPERERARDAVEALARALELEAGA